MFVSLTNDTGNKSQGELGAVGPWHEAAHACYRGARLWGTSAPILGNTCAPQLFPTALRKDHHYPQ